MNNIAFFIGAACVTWHGIIAGLGALAAVVATLLLRLKQSRPLIPVLCADFIAALFILPLSRFIYCYSVTERSDEFMELFLSGRSGGSAAGAICGLLLACAVTRLITRRWYPDQTAAGLLDCLLPSGTLGFAAGRMAGLFDASDKGRDTVSSPAFQRFPFSVPMADPITGEIKYHLAVFFFEAVAGYLIFCLSLAVFRRTYRPSGQRFPEGSAGISAITLFAAFQCVFDSMRYDKLVFHSNGFVSIMQILSLIILVVCVVIAVRVSLMRCAAGNHEAGKSAVCLMLLVNAGLMEYTVQRRAELYPQCYCAMLAALCCVSAVIMSMLRDPADAGETD